MATKAPSPNIFGGPIFRPWQGPKLDRPFEEDTKPSPSKYFSELHPDLSGDLPVVDTSTGVPTKEADMVPTSTVVPQPNQKKINLINNDSSEEGLNDCKVSSSSSSPSVRNSKRSDSAQLLPKRNYSEDRNGASRPKKKRFKMEPPEPTFPPGSSSAPSGGFPEIAHPCSSFAPFFHFPPSVVPSPHFISPLVPLLEPPILVPAEEVERVCARRPRPKRFSCGECGAAFSNRGQLSGHCRIHTGERPFRCTHPGCGKRFTRNEELTRHRRIHSGLRPFGCGICPKRFGRKDHLKKHLRTHTRHVLPPLPNLNQYNRLQFQHLQRLQHFQHFQQLHFQMLSLPPDQKCIGL